MYYDICLLDLLSHHVIAPKSHENFANINTISKLYICSFLIYYWHYIWIVTRLQCRQQAQTIRNSASQRIYRKYVIMVTFYIKYNINKDSKQSKLKQWQWKLYSKKIMIQQWIYRHIYSNMQIQETLFLWHLAGIIQKMCKIAETQNVGM